MNAGAILYVHFHFIIVEISKYFIKGFIQSRLSSAHLAMKTLAVVTILLFTAIRLPAQSPAIDSLNKILNKTAAGKDTTRAKFLIELAKQWSGINFDSALSFAKVGYSLSAKQNFERGMAESRNIMGWLNEKCLEAAIKAKQFAEETGSVQALATSYLNMGMVYAELKQFKHADLSLNKALYYFKQLKKEEQISRTYNGLANLYLARQDYVTAKSLIDSSNVIAVKLNNHPLLYDNYTSLVNINKQEGHFETASQLYEKMLALKDTLKDAEKNTAIERLKAAYDLEKKQSTIEELKKENLIKTQQRDYLILALIAGSLLIMMLVFSFVKIKMKNNFLSQQKKELIKLNELKDKFFSILNHDLRSPIGNILLVIDFLHSDIEISENEKKELLTKLKPAASSTLETMDNLLQWGKFQSQNISIVPKKINVQEIAERVSRFLDQTAINKSIVIANRIEEPFIVQADENQIEFIIRNLVSNSLKFSHTNSKVEIWARKINSCACIYVRDSGIGMSPLLQQNLFDANANASINGTAGEIGSGLGLVLCHEFITQNNGTLTVKSEEGIGTTFAVKLPALEN